MTVYLAVAYTHTLKVFNKIEVSNDIEKQSFSENLSHNFKVISNISNNVDKVIQLKQNWFFSIWPYTLPFDYIIDKLEDNYVLEFNKHIGENLKHSTEVSANLALQKKYSDHYGNVVRRLLESKILIDQKLKGNVSNFDSFEMPSVLMGNEFDNNYYGSLYKRYIKWNDDTEQLKLIRRFDEKLLNDMNIPQHPYDWLILWANQSKKVPTIKMSDYWSEYKGANEPEIGVAYNVSMLPNIDKFVANIDKYANPLKAPSYSSKFFANYSLSAYRTWRKFTNEFYANDKTVPTEASWYTVLEQNNYDGFYLDYADRLSHNFKPDLFINKPEWLKLFTRLDAYFSLSKIAVEKKVQLNKDSWITKIISKLNSSPDQINKQRGIPNYSEKILDAANAYLFSVYSLQNQALTLEDQPSFEAMLALASNRDNNNIPAVKGVRQAYKNFIDLKVITKNNISDLSINPNDVTWNFYRDNLDLLLYGISRKASCHIESVWDDKVLKDDGISASTTVSQLYGKKSSIYKFMEKYVYPFVEYDPGSKKFIPKKIYGQQINFSKDVYEYLNNEIYYRNLVSIANSLEALLKDQGSQTTIHTDPVSVNKGAKILPYSTVYNFVCNGKKESFTNYNTSLDFSIPSKVLSCQSISINVNFKGVDDFTASKVYSGDYPIIQLLSETNAKGDLVLQSNKLTGMTNKLEAYGIKSINIPISIDNVDVPALVKKYKENKELLIKNDLRSKKFRVTSCWKQ